MAAENSFDIACKVDMAEVANAVNQARREVETRYDLKGSKNEILEEEMDLVLTSADDMKLKAVLDILQSKLHRRGVREAAQRALARIEPSAIPKDR